VYEGGSLCLSVERELQRETCTTERLGKMESEIF
jgi:hypothetical protein